MVGGVSTTNGHECNSHVDAAGVHAFVNFWLIDKAIEF